MICRRLLILLMPVFISLSAVAQTNNLDKVEILKNKKHFESSIIGQHYVGKGGLLDSSFIEIVFEKRKLTYQKRSKFANYTTISRYRIVYSDSNMFTIEFIRKGRVYSRQYGYFVPPSKTEFYLIYELHKETDSERLLRMKRDGFLCKPQ